MKQVPLLHNTVLILSDEEAGLVAMLHVLYDFLGTVKAAPHECVIRTGQPKT